VDDFLVFGKTMVGKIPHCKSKIIFVELVNTEGNLIELKKSKENQMDNQEKKEFAYQNQDFGYTMALQDILNLASVARETGNEQDAKSLMNAYHTLESYQIERNK
jgi:hypothetical protein